MPWKGPDPDGDQWPTLGHIVAEWIEENLVVPDGPRRGQPFILTDEQYAHTLHSYRLHPNARPEMGSQAFQYYGSLLVRPQKALALDTPVATTTGWTTMGELHAGDTVYDRFGEPTLVTDKSPVYLGSAYKVTFDDGTSLVASPGHRWVVEQRVGEHYVEKELVTHELAASREMFRVPRCKPLQSEDVALPVPPYTLGAWLGDGDSENGRITKPDPELFEPIRAEGFTVEKRSQTRWQVHGLRVKLRAAGLIKNKHIPAVYLRASVAQRWALLQGLMDTDGSSVKESHRCEFTTTRRQLRDGVDELLHSLGIAHTIYEGRAVYNGKDCGEVWRLYFAARAEWPVFRLPRKAERLAAGIARGRGRPPAEYREIVSVELTEPVATQCISVESPTHTFLAGREMIPTGNSGKDPYAGAEACAQALGPVRFGGWDANGDPVGMPMPTPWIQCAANSEEQTDVTFRVIYSMLAEGPAGNIPGLDVGLTRVTLPDGGRIEPVTAAARSRLGARITFATLTESGLYTEASGGLAMARTMKRGLAGMDGRWIEITNAWDPAEESVAQRTFEAKAPGVYINYRAPRTHVDITDDQALRAELLYVYGDAAMERGGWVNIARIMEELRDPSTGEGEARRFFLNEIWVGSKDATDALKWATQARTGEPLEPGTAIAVGFHGSATRDATSLVASRMSDGRLFHLRTWEKPGHVPASKWSIPRDEVDQAVHDIFAGYDVTAMMCTPHLWQTEVNAWAGEFGLKDKQEAKAAGPGHFQSKILELWTNSEIRMDQLIERFVTAHRGDELTHDGDETLTRHVHASALANGRKRSAADERAPGLPEHYQRVVRKSWGVSSSAFIAALLAYEARGWAIEHGAMTNTGGTPNLW